MWHQNVARIAIAGGCIAAIHQLRCDDDEGVILRLTIGGVIGEQQALLGGESKTGVGQGGCGVGGNGNLELDDSITCGYVIARAIVAQIGSDLFVQGGVERAVAVKVEPCLQVAIAGYLHCEGCDQALGQEGEGDAVLIVHIGGIVALRACRNSRSGFRVGTVCAHVDRGNVRDVVERRSVGQGRIAEIKADAVQNANADGRLVAIACVQIVANLVNNCVNSGRGRGGNQNPALVAAAQFQRRDRAAGAERGGGGYHAGRYGGGIDLHQPYRVVLVGIARCAAQDTVNGGGGEVVILGVDGNVFGGDHHRCRGGIDVWCDAAGRAVCQAVGNGVDSGRGARRDGDFAGVRVQCDRTGCGRCCCYHSQIHVARQGACGHGFSVEIIIVQHAGRISAGECGDRVSGEVVVRRINAGSQAGLNSQRRVRAYAGADLAKIEPCDGGFCAGDGGGGCVGEVNHAVGLAKAAIVGVQRRDCGVLHPEPTVQCLTVTAQTAECDGGDAFDVGCLQGEIALVVERADRTG